MSRTIEPPAPVKPHSIASLVFLSLFLCVIGGCATGNPDGGKKTAQLSAEIKAANQKIDEIYHRLSVVQFMVDSHERVLSDRDQKLKKSGFVKPPAAGNGPEPGKEGDKTVTEETTASAEPVKTEEPAAGSENAVVTAEGAGAGDEKPAEASKDPETKESSAVDVTGKTPKDIYTEGLSALKAGDYPTAAAMFRALVAGYPDHDLADNAVYWTGEIFYDQKDYKEAIRIFTRLVETYPTGGKVPDALLKIGYSYHSMSDKDNAVKYLKKVVVEYPFTDPGGKAEAMLNKIEKSR